MIRCWLVLVVSAFLLCALCSEARKGDSDGLPSPGDTGNKTAGILVEEKVVDDPVKVGDGKKSEGDDKKSEGEAGVIAGKKEEKHSGDSQDGDAGGRPEVSDEDRKAGSGGYSSVSAVGPKDNAAHVEECDAPNRCVDEKNEFVACLRVPGNDSPTLSLLIQNKGTGSLTIKIVAPSYVSLEQNVVVLNADEDKKVKVTVEYGVNNTPILLSAGHGLCNLSFWDMIPSSIREGEGYLVPLHINLFVRSTFVYLALASVVLLGAAWLWVKFQRMHPRYQRLDGGLPVSSGGVMENDVAGWENSWEGTWDDDEAPKTPSKTLSNLSSKGLASRKFNKDGWKD